MEFNVLEESLVYYALRSIKTGNYVLGGIQINEDNLSYLEGNLVEAKLFDHSGATFWQQKLKEWNNEEFEIRKAKVIVIE